MKKFAEISFSVCPNHERQIMKTEIFNVWKILVVLSLWIRNFFKAKTVCIKFETLSLHLFTVELFSDLASKSISWDNLFQKSDM